MNGLNGEKESVGRGESGGGGLDDAGEINDVLGHVQPRLKLEGDVLFVKALAYRRMTPKRDDVLPTRFDDPPRVRQLLMTLSSRPGHSGTSAVPAEKRLPARAGAHADLERALRGQRGRGGGRRGRGAGAGKIPPRRIGRDNAREGLLDASERGEAHVQTAQIVREPMQRHQFETRRRR